MVAPTHCQHCIHLSDAGSCDVWLRMQGEKAITPVAIQVCKACGWRDCLPQFTVKKPVEEKGTSNDT